MKKSNSRIVVIGAVLGGILGAMGGAEHSSKLFRRLLLPGVLTAIAYWQTESILTISIMFMGIIFGIGYGIPSSDDDKPSIIGNFFYNPCHHNLFWTNIFTRGTIGLLVCASLISLPIINHNWKMYLMACGMILWAYVRISWEDMGVYKFFKWQLLWSETIVYSVIAFETLILVMK
jgi:hypothetical protein